MAFFGYLNYPISIPPVYDTTPCLEHLMEYEDCVIDTGTDQLQFFMPTWPTLWPGLQNGRNEMNLDTLHDQPVLHEDDQPLSYADADPLTDRQKQLLYE